MSSRKKCCQSFGSETTFENVNCMMAEIDKNSDGRISNSELKEMPSKLDSETISEDVNCIGQTMM